MSITAIKAKIEDHPVPVITVCLLVTASIIVFTFFPQLFRKKLPPLATQAYYYDLEANKVVPGPLQAAPPLDLSDNKGAKASAVRAYVFSCTSCDDDSSFVGYLLKLTDKGKKAAEESKALKEGFLAFPAPFVNQIELSGLSGATTRPSDSPMMISAPVEGPGAVARWVMAGSSEAGAIMEKAKTKCGQTPIYCEPK